MLKGAIFDLDGVIVNTVPIHFKAWKKMFSDYGKEFNFDDYKAKVDGIPRNDGAKAILTELNDEEIRIAATKKQDYFLDFIANEEVPRYESSINLVKELKNRGVRITIASSSKNCKRILTTIGEINLADAIVDGNDITRGKPDPQIFQLAAKKIAVAYEDCIVFEDAVLGVEAGKNANMICIGIDRYNQPERLNKADLVVRDLDRVSFSSIKELFDK